MEKIHEKLDRIEALILKHTIQTKDYLTLEQTSEYLQLSKSELYKMTSSNELPHYVPGGKKIYFKRRELDEWITSVRISPITEIDEKIDLYLGRIQKNSKR